MTRTKALEHAIHFDQLLEDLSQSLARFPWDCEIPLVTLRAADIVAVLDRFLDGDLSPAQVAGWAELLEMRDDIEFGATTEEHDATIEAIWLLANPLINFKGRALSADSALRIRESLED